VHGALQLKTNSLLSKHNGVTLLDIHSVEDKTPSYAAYDGARAAKELNTLSEVWENRPEYVRFTDENKGMIKEKLSITAELLMKLGI
jgi:hypothetical protein